MTVAHEQISLTEAARRLGVHYMTAYRYVRTGRLPAERRGSHWVVDAADLDTMRTPRPSGRATRTVRDEGPALLTARMIAGDERGAWTLVEDALTATLDPEQVYLELLAPALRDIGDAWAAGELGVVDEHRASVVASRLVGRLGPRFARRGRKRGTVVVAAVEGDRHALPSAILADLLRAAGFDVVDLGADTPPESLVEAAASVDALVAVLIGASVSGHDRSLRSTIRDLRAADVSAPVLVGGAAVDGEAHAHRLGADGYSGDDGARAVEAVEALLGRPR